jgi:hypothetical protein
MVRTRVERQHRQRPNPWEVAWIVIGDKRRFVAFVPKAEGWHLELFDASRREGDQQRFLISEDRPAFPVGQEVTVAMVAWEGGVFVQAQTADRPFFLDWRWSRKCPAPTWWQDPHNAGVYLEDCSVVVEWAPEGGDVDWASR